MALSAILNTGQIRKSKKSMTYPKNKRSIRFPNAPANIKLKEILQVENFLCLDFLRLKRINVMANKEIKINTGT